MLFVNADDFGRAKGTTDRILICSNQKKIHSAGAMVFMIDSERAADLAKENQLPVGFHLNLDEEITAPTVPAKLRAFHQATGAYLNARKWNQVFYNPFLRNAFDYVFQAQWDEFCRLYGDEPKRLDGHHHMHLCMNMLFSGKYPKGIKIRRNFSFGPSEKDPFNRFYRYLVDRWLTSRFQCTDYFFSITPIGQERLKRLVALSKHSDVEIMAHPGVDEEYRFLMSDHWSKLIPEAEKE